MSSLGHFSWIDWAVVAGLLALTTAVGHRAAGRQATFEDFFLGGRKLPWYAVAASIVATEISAVTFVSLPWLVFQPGGDLTYLQLGVFGALIARVIVGWVLLPAYYEREIYSPYDYMGARLGDGVRRTTTGLFTLGGILAQSCRVYLTALVLEVVLYRELSAVSDATGLPPLVLSVGAIGVVAVAWTWMGGIATVVWTDVLLFLVFVVGLGAAFLTVVLQVEGGVGGVLEAAQEAGKLRFLDASTDLSRPFTLWAALIASTAVHEGAYGTDQLMAQRIFCCKGPREARRAILASYCGLGVTALAALVGLALFRWYSLHPLSGEAAALVAEKGDRVFPIFALQELPAGLKGLVVAGVFAAAISSLDSILAALSQTTLSAFLPAEQHTVRRSRALVLAYGALLCTVAVLVKEIHDDYPSVLELALAMATYTWGALLAGFLLAFLSKRRDGSGFVWSAPLSVAAVYAAVWHGDGPRAVLLSFAAVVVVLWLVRGRPDRRRTAVLLLGLALVLAIERFGVWRGTDEAGEVVVKTLAWPWNVPLGCIVALVFAAGLGRSRPVP